MKRRSRPWTGSYEDYFGIGWWCLRWMIPHWMRADLALQGLLPDLKQSLKEAAVLSSQAQEPSKAAASRAQRHIHRWLTENGYRRDRGSKGYSNRSWSLESGGWNRETRNGIDFLAMATRVRQLLADHLPPEDWDHLMGWAMSGQGEIPPSVLDLIEEVLGSEPKAFKQF